MVKNLRKLRIDAKLTQQQLADILDTTQQSINKYENHNVEPDIRALTMLADYFHTTIDYLVGHTPISDTDLSEMLELSKDECSFIQDFRKLSMDEQESIKLVIQNYLKNK